MFQAHEANFLQTKETSFRTNRAFKKRNQRYEDRFNKKQLLSSAPKNVMLKNEQNIKTYRDRYILGKWEARN